MKKIRSPPSSYLFLTNKYGGNKGERLFTTIKKVVLKQSITQERRTIT